MCFPGLWVSLFPGSFLVLGSSFPVLVIYGFLLRGTRGGIWILPSAPLRCFILLSLTSGLLFLFLATVFRLFSWFEGFFSYFSDLVFCSSQSCLGLQWFWSSCPFRCWGSRLPLPIAVFCISSHGLCSFLFPDFVPGWFVLRLLRWCSAVSSFFPAFSRLADPCYFYSPALSFALFLGGSALHVFLLLAFGPLGWLFILSPYPWSTRCFCWSVPTVVLWVLLGLRVLPCPCVRGFSYQGVLVLCLRFVSIRPPSFPAPQVSYGLVVVSPGWSPPLWLYSFTRPTFVHCGLVFCCLSPV